MKLAPDIRRPLMAFAAFALSIAAAVSARAATPDSEDLAQTRCDRIAHLYASCGQASNFRYDGRDFVFAKPGVHETVMCDDGRKLDFYDRMDAMDMQSIFQVPYVTDGTPLPETRENWDPGRLRNETLLKATYGATSGEVRANLVSVPFLNQRIPFQKKLGAAHALEAVGRELMETAKTDAALAKFLKPFTSGRIHLNGMTFNWRDIAGTHRMSAHSFGTAIDVLTGVGPEYWLWDEKKDHPSRASKGENGYRGIHYVPKAAPIFNATAVSIFEKHGFIWGGKWNHYDSMHFEYRPEMIEGAEIECE